MSFSSRVTTSKTAKSHKNIGFEVLFSGGVLKKSGDRKARRVFRFAIKLIGLIQASSKTNSSEDDPYYFTNNKKGETKYTP